MPKSPKSIDIESVLDFTSDDLDLNRQGKLSPHQIARLQAMARAQRVLYLTVLRRLAIVCIVINAVFFGMAIIPFGGASFTLPPALVYIVPALTIVILVVGATNAIYRSGRTQRNLGQGLVLSVCGKVSLHKFTFHSKSGYSKDYIVEVEKVQFQVPASTFAAFHNGHNYIIYYVPLIRMTLVAAEEIA